MKKLCRKGTVHPTPPVSSDHFLSFLPAAILTLTAALSEEDREVLAYLISCSSANSSSNHHKANYKATASSKVGADQPPSFNCNCFRCYMSYWVKWDASPNRQLIHEIIDAFEDSLLKQSKKEKNKKEKRKGKNVKKNLNPESAESKKSELSPIEEDFKFDESNSSPAASGECGDGGNEEDSSEEEELGKVSVRRLVSFLGERIWSIWG